MIREERIVALRTVVVSAVACVALASGAAPAAEHAWSFLWTTVDPAHFRSGFEAEDSSGNLQLDDASGLCLRWEARSSPLFGFELGLLYGDIDVVADVPGYATESATMDLLMPSVGLDFHLLRRGCVDVSVAVVAAYAVMTEAEFGVRALDDTAEIGNGLGVGARAGVDIHLGKPDSRLVLHLGVQRLDMQAKVRSRNEGIDPTMFEFGFVFKP